MESKQNSAIKMLGIAAFIAGSIIGSVTEAADTKTGQPKLSLAENFVLDTGQQAISILEKDEKHHFELKRLFRKRFDYKLMGRYAMGRYWQKADAKQQSEYNLLFAEYVPNGYMGQMKEFRGADIALVKSRSISNDDTIITTSLAPKSGDTMTFDWRVRAQSEQFKVIDLVVGGVSYLKMLRQQFTSIAARGGVEGLLNLLRKHAKAKAADTGEEFRALADRLRSTDAIGFTTKVSLKSKVDALVTDLSRHHEGESDSDIDSLKQRFDKLIRSAINMLRDGDPSLAEDMASIHPTLWRALKDPEEFVVVAM